ncbi:MAG TPA: hypothetical protein VFZ26_01090 [Gemmatimonadales bacterium]
MRDLIFRCTRGRGLAPLHLSLFTLHVFLAPSPAPAQAPIADNSFLIEEAYNQEAGVVQHISTLSRPDGGEAWDFSFTQEWPLDGRSHQLGFTMPVSYMEGTGTGIGDVALHYRHQLAGRDAAPLFVAPRLSLLLPTGSEAAGRGAGALGVQANLPVSYVLAPALAAHWNAGATLGTGETTLDFNLGASAVWRLRPAFNLLVEAVWLEDGEGERTVLNPGIRWAHDLSGGLQIVPGLAYTIDLGPGSAGDGLFLYLSVEHPFRQTAPGPS